MDVDTRVTDGLRDTFASGRTRRAGWRRAQLRGILRLLDAHERELIAALRADLGRPPAEAIAADIGHTRAEVRHLLRRFEAWMRPRRTRVPLIAMPARAEVRPEPLGVVLVIAPWNYPPDHVLVDRRVQAGFGSRSQRSPQASHTRGDPVVPALPAETLGLAAGIQPPSHRTLTLG